MMRRRVFQRAMATAVFSGLLCTTIEAAEVNRSYIDEKNAVAIMKKEYKMSNGKVTQIQFAIQTFDLEKGKSGYLVVDVSKSEIDKLNKELQGKGNQYVESWILEKKKAVILEYFKSKKPQKFTIDLFPLVASPTAPKIEGPKVEGKIPSIALPRQVKGGQGTKDDPFVVRPEFKRGINGEGSEKFNVPMKFDIEGIGPVFFKFNFTLSQISKKSRDGIVEEITKIVRPCIEATRQKMYGETIPPSYSESLNKAIQLIRRNMLKIEQTISDTDPKFASYLKKN